MSREGDPQIVFTARQYRRLIHETPGYRAFLRTLFATNSLLFLGFSFTDAYINDLRSEVLAMVGLDAGQRPFRDFAVLADVNDEMARHFEDVEGLVPLPYKIGPDSDHSGFDRWLESIATATEPATTLRERLRGWRLLWVNPKPRNNQYGFDVLTRADGAIEVSKSPEDALERMARQKREALDRDYNLVISHWGYQGATEPANAERLLTGMHQHGLHAPVIVFASGAYRHDNRRQALRLGALAYTDSWAELFETLDGLVTDRGARRR